MQVSSIEILEESLLIKKNASIRGIFTICGTHVQAILDQKNLTGLEGGVREGQNMAQNGPRLFTFFASEPSRGP